MYTKNFINTYPSIPSQKHKHKQPRQNKTKTLPEANSLIMILPEEINFIEAQDQGFKP